jgi:hypothetical protein
LQRPITIRPPVGRIANRWERKPKGDEELFDQIDRGRRLYGGSQRQLDNSTFQLHIRTTGRMEEKEFHDPHLKEVQTVLLLLLSEAT